MRDETVITMDSYRLRVAAPPDSQQVAKAPFPLCFTGDALEQLLATVGSLPPETGAKGFGPLEGLGIDLVEFDEPASQTASGGVYSPDVAWGDERVQHHLNQPGSLMRVWTGDVHSHPGGLGQPSRKDGRGTGDLGYVEEVFAQNEAILWFLLPILTNTGEGMEVVIHPWVCKRGEPVGLYWAELKVCGASQFPPREFNPEWEASCSEPQKATISEDSPFDLEFFQHSLGIRVTEQRLTQDGLLLGFPKEGMTVTLVLSPKAPWEKPFLSVRRGGKDTHITQFRWRRKSTLSLEIRLVLLCSQALQFASQDF
jgi:hypothetical protein